LDDVTSVHEDEPEFDAAVRPMMRNISFGPTFLYHHKFPKIVSYNTKHYLETSHAVCKGFVEAFWAWEVMPKYVILKRNPREVAKSLFKMNSVPGRTFDALRHLVHPADPFVLPLFGWETLNDYQLCFWFAIEMERRQFYYHEMFNSIGTKSYVINMYDLLDWDKFNYLLKFLGFPEQEKSHYQEIISGNQNPKPEIRNFKEEIGDNYKELEQVIWKHVFYYQPLLIQKLKQYYKEGDLF